MAPEARYHKACDTRFSGRKLAQETESRKSESKKNEEMILVFEQTCIWLENDISIHSIKNLGENWLKYARKKSKEKAKEKKKDVHNNRLIKQKNRILKAAGNLIKAEIREQIYANEYCPSIDDIAAKNWIPNNLQKLLWVLIQSEVKIQSLD